MSDETKTTPEEGLEPNAPVELNDNDKKIAAKRAKKKGIPKELAEQARQQELNAQQAQKLTIEYNQKLNALYFVLQPVLRQSVDALFATFELRPMNAAEVARFQASQGKGANAPAGMPAEGEGEAKKEEASSEEPAPDDEASEPVEPEDIPA